MKREGWCVSALSLLEETTTNLVNESNTDLLSHSFHGSVVLAQCGSARFSAQGLPRPKLRGRPDCIP